MIIQGNNPYLQPSFSLANRLLRGLWVVVGLISFRSSSSFFHVWHEVSADGADVNDIDSVEVTEISFQKWLTFIKSKPDKRLTAEAVENNLIQTVLKYKKV